MPASSPARQLEVFLGRYSPEVGKVARQALRLLRRNLRGAFELVYDNYNALAIGFSPSDRASDVILSVAVYPRWVSLFFMRGAALPDPSGLLRGSGRRVRHIRLESAAVLKTHGIQRLIHEAIERSPKGLDPAAARRLLIKSISATQRPRRPSGR
jgi:hypothetical protein